MFGPTHRYGTAPVGTEATLKALTAQDLQAFHRAMYQPSNATLIVVGDITAAAVLPLLETAVRWLEGGRPRRRHAGARPRRSSTRAGLRSSTSRGRRSRRFASAGSACRARRRTTSRSRCSTRSSAARSPRDSIRTCARSTATRTAPARGSTCGCRPVRSWPPPASRPTRPPRRCSEFFKELDGIQKPVRADELDEGEELRRARASRANSRRSTISRAHLEELVVYKLPDDYFARYVANVQAVTAAAVQKAAATIHPAEKFAVVVVGDRKVDRAEDPGAEPRSDPVPVRRRGRRLMSVAVALAPLIAYSDHERDEMAAVDCRGSGAAAHPVSDRRTIR